MEPHRRRGVAHETIGHDIVQPPGKDGTPHAAAYDHVYHVEDAQPLEEMVEVYHIMERGHEHYAQCRVGKAMAEERSAEMTYAYRG